MKKQLREEHPDWDDKKISSRAYAICVKSTGQHPSDEEGTDKMAFEEADCHKAAGDKKSNYALAKGDNKSDWALPYKNADGSINKACVRNALARWNQVQGYSDEEKKSALTKLRRAARSVGIEVSGDEMKEPICWTSTISVHESFDGAMSSLKRPSVRAIYGLKETQLETLHEAVDGVKMSDTHFFIVGEAIHPITTLNQHKYESGELEMAAETLAGCPLMVDHGKGSLDNAGRVLVSAWEESLGLSGAISYVARIRKSHPVAEAVRVGDIDTVSIGANANKIECSVCGDDMRYCSHLIGRKYELDGEEVTAIAIGRGLQFRELSITPFPADARATARVPKIDSLESAMSYLVESSEFKETLLKAGDKEMSEDNNEELALAERIRDLEAEKKQLQENMEQIAQKNEEFQKREKADLVGRAFELEVEANISKSEDESVRKTELKAMSVEVLRAKIEDMKRVVEQMEKMRPPKSQSVVAEEPEKERKKPLTYRRETVKAGLREALGGMRTSEKAQRIVRKDALSTQNPNYTEYKRLTRKNIEKLGRNE